MSLSECEHFTADLQSSESLGAEAGKAEADGSQASPMARAVAFAVSKSYAFTADEMREHARTTAQVTAKAAGKELSDVELDAVAAGSNPYAGGMNTSSSQAAHTAAQASVVAEYFEAAKKAKIGG
ncbi:MAG: hypothetical protein Q8N31_01760 [Reyranella sp.]|nr:hypothetical protein [Reyranella sp.]MDP3158715.1 hypothetical protein [Reyranella sp.]